MMVGNGVKAQLGLVLALLFATAIALGSHASGEASYNWGGYVASNNLNSPPLNSVLMVNGSWIVQNVTETTHPEGWSTQWIGIDGWDSGNLIQTGTESDSQPGYVGSQYYAWYETLPSDETPIAGFTVSPGDVVYANVVLLNQNTYEWQMNIEDITQDESFSVNVNYYTPQGTAEWIDERTYVGVFPPLADYFRAFFGPDYTDLGKTDSATINGITANLYAQSGIPITLLNCSDVGLGCSPTVPSGNNANPSTLSSTGSFYSTVTLLTIPTVQNQHMDLGQSAVISANVSGGYHPYTFAWYSEAPGSGTFTLISGATSSTYTFTSNALTTPGLWYFEDKVTDAAGTVAAANALVSLNVVPTLNSVPTVSAAIVSQKSNFTAIGTNVFGGAGPITYQWRQKAPGSSTFNVIPGANAFSFISTSTYPTQIDAPACTTYANVIYCVGGQYTSLTNTLYYASINSSGTGTWATSANTYPQTSVGGLTPSISCNAYLGYIYCIGGQTPSGVSTKAVYSAQIVPGGTTTWTADSAYPVNGFGQSCSIYNGYIYCAGDSPNNYNSVYYAQITSNAIGSWTATNSIPQVLRSYAPLSCNTYNAYIYCVGASNNQAYLGNLTYYAPIGSYGVGAWQQSSTYPTYIYEPDCDAYGGFITCQAGYNSQGYANQSYYAPISSSGIGAWSPAPSYPVSVYGNSCTAASNGFQYCVGGCNGESYQFGSSIYYIECYYSGFQSAVYYRSLPPNLEYNYRTSLSTTPGNYLLELYATDSGNPQTTVNSLPTSFNVVSGNAIIASLMLLNSSSVVSKNVAESLTAVVNSGTPPYTYNFMVYNSVGSLVANGLYGGISSTSNVFAFTPTASSSQGIYTANVVVDDSAPSSASASNVFAVSDLSYNLVPPANTNVETGQYTFITFNQISGGVPPYNSQSAWLTFPTYNVPFGESPAFNVPSSNIVVIGINFFSSNEIAYSSNNLQTTNTVMASASNTIYGQFLTYEFFGDSSGTNIATPYIMINYEPKLSTEVMPPAQQIGLGTQPQIAISASGGYAPYTYNFVVLNSQGGVVANGLVTETSTSMSAPFNIVGSGSYTINTIVTDSASVPVSVSSSNSFNVVPSYDVHASNSVVDVGQWTNITANGIYAGITAYSAGWNYFPANAPASNTAIANTIPAGIGQWLQSNSFTSAESGSACAAVNSIMYCVGGIANSEFTNTTSYAPITTGGFGQWRLGSASGNYPFAVADSGCSAFNATNTVYCIGGLTSSFTPTSVAYYSSVSSSGQGNWIGTNAYPQFISYEQCPVYGNYIYCIGGYQSPSYGPVASAYYSQILPSGALTRWQQTTSYPAAVWGLGCSEYNGYAYCIGGYNGSDEPVNSVYYAPLSPNGIGAWAAGTAYPQPIYAQSCPAYGGYLYCVGGNNATTTTSGVYYAPIYSSNSVGGWLQSGSYPSATSYGQCAPYNAYIYCLTGATANTAFYSQLAQSASIDAYVASSNQVYLYFGSQNTLISTAGTVYGTWNFSALVAASGIESFVTSNAQLSINPTLSVSAASATNSSVTVGATDGTGSTSLSASASGGAPPYTYQWEIAAPPSLSYGPIPGANTANYVYVPTSGNSGTYYIRLNVTDSDTTGSVASSTPMQISLTNNQGSGGGGGSGGSGSGAPAGGGGPFKPTVIPFSNATTTCNYIVNFTQDNYVVANFYNQSLFIRNNYVTPSSGGITINNVTPEQLGFETPITYTNGNVKYTMTLYNVSYLPILQTVKISICTAAPKQQAGSSYNISSGFRQTFDISKYNPITLNASSLGMGITITSSSFATTPFNFSLSQDSLQPIPGSFRSLGVVNMSFGSDRNVTVSTSWSYECSIQQSTIAPFILQNGIWLKIHNYTFSSGHGNLCNIDFRVPGDPILGLFTNKSVGAVTTTTTTTAVQNTTVATTTAAQGQTTSQQQSTTSTLPIPPQSGPPIPPAYFIGAGVLAVIAILLYIIRRKKDDDFSFDLAPKEPKMPSSEPPAGMPKLGGGIFGKFRGEGKKPPSPEPPKPPEY